MVQQIIDIEELDFFNEKLYSKKFEEYYNSELERKNNVYKLELERKKDIYKENRIQSITGNFDPNVQQKIENEMYYLSKEDDEEFLSTKYAFAPLGKERIYGIIRIGIGWKCNTTAKWNILKFYDELVKSNRKDLIMEIDRLFDYVKKEYENR